MKTLKKSFTGSLVILLVPLLSGAADTGKTFPTPEAAVAALKQATSTENASALRAIFGPAVADIQNPDRVQATNDFNTFTTALSETNHLVPASKTTYILEVGTNDWPFPVPIVKKDGGWFFDTQAGKEEILNRRIGGNELEVLQVMRAYVDAQREYASKDRDGDQVLEYAQKLASSPGKMDGLYWPPELDGEISPLGPLVADAQEEGYQLRKKARGASAENAGPQPFHGYYFRILTRQGKHAPGGKYDYIINGNMIGGFALVAWPADYEQSGIMTFIVNQQGRVYQQDLGEKTEKIASKMTTYDPDPKWQLSRD
jgi:hypothetical protein